MKEVLGVSKDSELAEHLKQQPQTIYNWKKRGTIPIEECIKIAQEKGVSLDYLLLGVGAVDSPLSEDGSDRDFAKIPLYDIEAAAGDGSLFDHENILKHLKFRKDWLAEEGLHLKDLVALSVSGDSMHGTVHDRDTILVNRARKKPDGVFLIRVGDNLRIKRVQELTDGSLRLSSDNEMYAPEVLPLEQLGQVQVIGHCHWRGGRVY